MLRVNFQPFRQNSSFRSSEAFGKENIENVEVEMSRLTVTVKDIDLVNPEVLKQNGANNVLLVGNKVKCSFGDKATEIYNILK